VKKNILLCLSVCLLLFVANTLHAAGIAVISHANITPYKHAIEGFRSQVGLPLHVYYLSANDNDHGDTKRAIVEQQPELILALGTHALSVAHELNTSVPVIFAFVLYPERIRKSELRASQYESGIAMTVPAKQQFKTLLQLVPGIQTIGVVYDPKKSSNLIQQATFAADALGLNLTAVAVANQREAAQAISHIFTSADAVWVVPDTTVLTSTTFRQMVRLSVKYAVALIGLAPKYVRSGSLFSLSFDSRATGRQAGDMAGRMLNGKKLPPLVSPDTTNLVINRQTADRLGLMIPAPLIKKATHIYPENNGVNH